MKSCNCIKFLYKKKKSKLNRKSTFTKKHISLKDFIPLKLLGEGRYGKVFLVKNKQKLFVLKEVKKNNNNSEIEILNNINNKSPFIVKFYFEFHTHQYTYIIQDYLPGGDLHYHLCKEGRFAEHVVRFYAAEIALALDFLHNNQIILHDLKPENIMFGSNGHIYLIDFGLAETEIVNSCIGSKHICGTIQYMAPELFDDNNCEHGTSVDWWSYGIVIYQMLIGIPPWYEDNNDDTIYCITHEPIEFPGLYNDSYQLLEDSEDIIIELLDRNPITRLGSGKYGFINIMHHPFFKETDWKNMKTKNITPPFIPNIENLEDAQYFESTYTSQIPEYSQVTEIVV